MPTFSLASFDPDDYSFPESYRSDPANQTVVKAIHEFKDDIREFLKPLSVFDKFSEVNFRRDSKEFDFVSGWFAKQIDNGKPPAELEHLYGLYLGELLCEKFDCVGAWWNLDPRPDSATYLKPVIGPFPCGKRMKYVNPFDYVVQNWIQELPNEAHYLLSEVTGWFEQTLDDMSSSAQETYFYRRMHNHAGY